MITSKIKTAVTLTTLSLILGACSSQDQKQKETLTKTLEQIQAENGKPARIVIASTISLTDIRKFSGSIEGIQQTNATAKLSDPIKSIKVSVGSTVQKDQLLAEFFYTGDNTKYQQSEEQVKLLEASTQRLRDVYAKGGLSKQDLDQAETQLRIAKLNQEAARRETLVLAPASGVITEVRFKEGEVPGVNTTLFTIARLDQVILKLPVTSQDIGLFKKGATATVNLNGEELKGKVSLVPLAANATTRFFPVEITFNNKGRKLLPGMFVTAEINVRNIDAVAVPNEAIVYKNGLNTVWIVQNGKAVRKIVTPGVSDKDYTQIISGIAPSDTVMLEGMSKMNEGDKVLIVK
jgi:RND family efflux transporter MFP subunit